MCTMSKCVSQIFHISFAMEVASLEAAYIGRGCWRERESAQGSPQFTRHMRNGARVCVNVLLTLSSFGSLITCKGRSSSG